MASIAAAGLWQLRRDTIDSRARELSLLGAALADEIDRGLRGAEEGLRALRSELAEGRLALVGAEATQALHTRADLMPLVSAIWLVDVQGHGVASSGAAPPPQGIRFAPTLDRLPEAAIALSGPWTDPLAHEPVVTLALRAAAESPGGVAWILAAVPVSALKGAFAAAPPTPDARMAVFRGDGMPLVGDDLVRAGPVTDAVEVRPGADDREVLVSVHIAPQHGLQVLVLHDLPSILAAWQRAATVAAALLTLILLSLLVGAHLLQVANARRQEAHEALQARLQRASRLEALGTLAGGAARDFNEVLAGIGQSAERALAQAPPGSALSHSVQGVVQAARRGQALVDRLVAASQGGVHARVVFELQPLVEAVLDGEAARWPSNIRLVRQLQAPGARLRGDPAQAREALVQLCQNAVQAMPAGGALRVGLRRQSLAATQVYSHSLALPGPYLALSVTDEGSGISAAVMEHLFEPFYTTRAAQGASGLGLAIVHGFVSEADGAVDVGHPGSPGACFTLYLPECAEALHQATDAADPNGAEAAPGRPGAA